MAIQHSCFFFLSASKRWSDFKVHDQKKNDQPRYTLAGGIMMPIWYDACRGLFVFINQYISDGRSIFRVLLDFLVAHNIGTLCNIFLEVSVDTYPPTIFFVGKLT